MRNKVATTAFATIIAVVLAATVRADEMFSNPRCALTSTTISGCVQSDTLVRVDNAQRLHRSGIAGQVWLTQQVFFDSQTYPFQATLFVWVILPHRLLWIGQFTTAGDGTFDINLPPGTYIIAPVLPPEASGFSSIPVTVAIQPKQKTLVDINIFLSALQL